MRIRGFTYVRRYKQLIEQLLHIFCLFFKVCAKTSDFFCNYLVPIFQVSQFFFFLYFVFWGLLFTECFFAPYFSFYNLYGQNNQNGTFICNVPYGTIKVLQFPVFYRSSVIYIYFLINIRRRLTLPIFAPSPRTFGILYKVNGKQMLQ